MAGLDPVIHQAARLQVMSVLHRNRSAGFTEVQQRLGLTPGNLDSHVGRLVEAGYVERGRALTAAGFQVRLRITPKGLAAFQEYLAALRDLVG